jgi:hypothetical protein
MKRSPRFCAKRDDRHFRRAAAADHVVNAAELVLSPRAQLPAAGRGGRGTLSSSIGREGPVRSQLGSGHPCHRRNCAQLSSRNKGPLLDAIGACGVADGRELMGKGGGSASVGDRAGDRIDRGWHDANPKITPLRYLGARGCAYARTVPSAPPPWRRRPVVLPPWGEVGSACASAAQALPGISRAAKTPLGSRLDGPGHERSGR